MDASSHANARDARANFLALQDIKKRLSNALESIHSEGTFADFRRIPLKWIQPFIVRDVGQVKLPLKEPAIRRLIEKARQSPYGRGSETLVDTSVRNTWELDAAQLDMTTSISDQWTKTVASACEWVAARLGIPVPVKAELYKMLIYEKGAMFKPHTDTEKIPGMFGTLVICLPSDHKGGDLVLKHRNETKVFSTSEAQPEPSMFCWYADVTHEVLPVTEGYRCVLTYNLALSEPEAVQSTPSATLNDLGQTELRKALKAWLEFPARNPEKDNHLYSSLDYNYTEASISFNTLKGDDRARIQCLRDVCKDLGMTVLLALLEKVERGHCEDDHRYWDYNPRTNYRDGSDDSDSDEDSWHEFEDVLESDLTIERLLTLDGRTLRTNMELDGGDIWEYMIQEYDDPFEGCERGEEDYSGLTGNEGVTATHWYKLATAVIVPNDSLDVFLTTGLTRIAAQDLLPEYLKKCSDPTTRESAMKTVKHLAQFAWSGKFHSRAGLNFEDEIRLKIQVAIQFLETMLRLGEYEEFNKALGWFKGLATHLQLFTLIATVASSEAAFDFSQVKNSLLTALASRSLLDRLRLLNVIAPSDGDNAQLRDWAANEAVPSALEACKSSDSASLTAADGVAIVKMIQEFHDFDYIKTKLIPIIEQRVSVATAFTLAALLSVIDLATQGVFEKATSLALCKPLLKSAISAMDITTLRTKDTPVGTATSVAALEAQRYNTRPAYDYGTNTNKIPEQFVHPSLLPHLFSRCIEFKWDDLSMLLSLKIADGMDSSTPALVNTNTTSASAIPGPQYRGLWIPFLRQLIPVLESHAIPLSTPRYQQLACAILESYLDGHVGKEPTALDEQAAAAHRRDRRHNNPEAGRRLRQEWNSRFLLAWDDINGAPPQGFDHSKLKVLLGEKDYQRIVGMKHLKAPGSSSGGGGGGAASGSSVWRETVLAGGGGGGHKRKASDHGR